MKKILSPVKQVRLFVIAILSFGAAIACANDNTENDAEKNKMLQSKTFSLEIDKPGYFPLGMLGDHDFDTLPLIGFNLSEKGHTYYGFKDDKPARYKPAENRRGKFFIANWAAHTLYRSRETKSYGTLKNSYNDQGKPHGHHMINYFDPTTRQYVLECAAASAKVVVEADDPSIAIWGIDNEWEAPLDYSPEALQAFYPWLDQTYAGDLAKLNEAWNSDYKSFQEAVPPKLDDYKDRPGAWLDWRRFQEEAYTDFVVDFFKATHEADPQRRPVISKSTQCTIEMCAVARKRINNHAMLARKALPYSKGWFGIDIYGHGDRNNYELNYLYNCVADPTGDIPGSENQAKLFVAETNNHAGPGWQYAHLFWRNLANGFKGVNFFHLGYYGGRRDYSTFGFTYPNGVRRDKFYYASRFAGLIHRSEAFWTEAVPSPDARKVALLMPQRDVMLSAESRRSWWDYPENNRLKVYGWLRSAGYWVDAIPYAKLTPDALKGYQALFLVGAEHLSQAECDGISSYVKQGGVLVADTRAGYFDEHHLQNEGLNEVLGLKTLGEYKGIDVSPNDIWYHTEIGNVIRGDGKIVMDLTTAKLLNEEDVFNNDKSGKITLNQFGEGHALWFNTRLGVLRGEMVDDAFVAKWLTSYLQQLAQKPSYQTDVLPMDKVRLEVPMIDSKGNCAIIVSGNSSQSIPAGKWEVAAIPGINYTNAFFADAEHVTLQKLDPIELAGDKAVISLPEFRSAGVIYLFRDHDPLLGISIVNPEATYQEDPYTPLLTPGSTVTVSVQVANASLQTQPAGDLRLELYRDFKCVPESITTPELAPGEIRTYQFSVTLDKEPGPFKPNMPCPFVARWSDGQKDKATINLACAMKSDPSCYVWLLSGNPMRSDSPLSGLPTGFEYSYPVELKEGQIIRDPSSNNGRRESSGSGLVNGLDWSSRIIYAEGLDNLPVLFDLKNDYSLKQIRISRAKKPYPMGCTVSISHDGETFSTIQEIDDIGRDGTSRWREFEIDNQTARYVRFDFKLAGRGYLDEIEIYGSPLSQK